MRLWKNSPRSFHASKDRRARSRRPRIADSRPRVAVVFAVRWAALAMVMTVIALRCTTLRVIVSRSEEKKEGAQGGAGGTSKGPGVRVQGPEWKAEDPAYEPATFQLVSPSADGNDSRHFRTLTRLRDGRCSAKDCRVLMTGCGRSGTHFIAEQLTAAGVPILHERIGEVGTISWVHAAPYREELGELEAWFSDEASVALRASPSFQFFPVFHLVRHPLAAITSLTECFCGCGSMSCGGWADPPSWKWAGKFVEFSDRYCSRTKNNEVCISHHHKDGRLLRSMEYWLHWNRLADSQAHFRLQLETVDLSEVIAAAPHMRGLVEVAKDSRGGGPVITVEQQPFVSKRGRGKRSKAVTWEWMRSADASLEEQVWELAQSYGYSRDPP